LPMTRRSVALTTCRVVVLALVVAVPLAGCGGGPGEPGPSAPVPTRTAPPPSLSPATTVSSAPPRMVDVVDGYDRFIVSAQQYELIGKRLNQVLRREGLWDQGVRFGANFDPDTGEYFVLIKPGRSRLSARQILDRLLGIA
jgi:hypothetical protein